MLYVYKYQSHSFPRQKRSLPPFDWGAREREGGRPRKETLSPDTSAFSPPDKGGPGISVYYVLFACVYLYITYVYLCLSRGEKKGTHGRESYRTQKMLTAIPLTPNPPPGSTGFGPRPRAPASLWSSAPTRPDAHLRPPRPPPLLPSSLPSPGTREAHSRKERSVRPQGGG